MKELRFAVLGADRRGKLSLLAHRPGAGSRLVAACSLAPERLTGYREQCGDEILLTDDFRVIVEDPSIDGVFICTPDHLHEEHALAALRAGKHVFLEKPMAITIAGCDAILEAARQSSGRLYVGHNLRFAPVFRKMKALIDAGAVGRVQAIWCRHFISYGGDAYFRDWHSERCHTTGLLLQKGAHDIDVIHWLAGGHTQRVVGMGKLSVYDQLPRRTAEDPVPSVDFNRANWPPRSTDRFSPVIDVEDHSMILMHLDNGVQASYQQCHYTPDDHRNYTVIGDAGRLENYGDHSVPDRWASVHLWNRRTGYSEHGHEIFRIPHLDGSHGGADPLMVDDFLAFIRGNPRVGADPLD
ncbi:MAG TPA: Gfo/Idh/MocA family oxidoreductase, partial [Terrimicrobiaceae bacterium]|nr:Gfo/Idh/MocA family oxidoreductase [Terrimicrobiaceae bacterium]